MVLVTISVAVATASGVALAINLYGTNGADTLTGTVNDDGLRGLSGNDTISGMGGGDYLVGDDGDDLIFGAYEKEGDVTVADGRDLIYGDAGNDTISADPGADMVRGGLGNDAITSGPDAAADEIFANEGNDTIDVADDPAFKDTVYCGPGTDDRVVADSLDVMLDGAACETVDRLLSDQQLLSEDANVYASDYGVSVEEAKRRLGLQDAVGDLLAQLEVNEAATFADLELLHEPTFEVVAYFTQGGEQTILPYVKGTALEGMVRVEQVDATAAELEAAQAEGMRVAEANGFLVESDVDVTANRAELYVAAADRPRFDAAVQSGNLVLPDRVDAVKVDALSQPMTFYGGTHLTSCTAGFVVKGDGGGEGATTAGHCPDSQNWRAGTTRVRDQYTRDTYDVAYLDTKNHEDKARFYSGVGLRPVRYVRGRDRQFIGRIVCKYGKNAGFKCGKIVGKRYAPGNTVPSADRKFMRVERRGGNIVYQGDSGGPVFDGYTALGTITARASDSDMIYMAINYAYSAPVGISNVQTVN